VGDLVWLKGINLKLTHLKAKLDTKRYGPFPITKEISLVVYQLALPPQWHIHNVFHASLLTPYKEMEEHGDNFAQPTPELIKGQEEYKVDVTVLRPHHSGQPTSHSSSSSNTSSGSASQSTLEAVTLDTPDQQTAWILAACQAA
jgi:hypothetical protein